MKKAKRIIGLGLCIAVFCSLVSMVSAYSSNVSLGDVNGDGKITSADARTILRHSARLEMLEGDALTAADVNFDGKITSADARTVLRVSAKLEELPDMPTEPTTKSEETTESTAVTQPTTESNMEFAKDTPCPYCGKTDCPTVIFDVKLGIYRHDPDKAELCPVYEPTTTAEPTTEPAEVIPEPCSICGFITGHLPECPNYSIFTDPVYYCQVCGFPVGIGLDKCDKYLVDTYCPECGEFCRAWECHHCPGTK